MNVLSLGRVQTPIHLGTSVRLIGGGGLGKFLQTFQVPDQKLFGGLACLFDLLSILGLQSLLLNVIKMNFYSFRIFIGSDKFVLYS